MDLQTQYKLIEESIAHLGVNVEDARCAEEGQWLLFRDDLELYIDVWKEEANEWSYHPNSINEFTFQVVCPIAKLTSEDKKPFFYEDLLQMNFYTQKVSYFVNKEEGMFACSHKRIMNSISKTDIIEAIDAVGYYSDLAWKMLNQPYDLKKI